VRAEPGLNTRPPVRTHRADHPQLGPEADRDQGIRADGLTSEEREELRRLRPDNKIFGEESGS
jgi:hypothetical protein